MSPSQFKALTKLTGLRSPKTAEALRLVLVFDHSVTDAAKLAGVSQSSASHALARARKTIILAEVVLSNQLVRNGDRTIHKMELVSEWQPIETAPKDGREVLIRSLDLGLVVVYWDEIDCSWGTGFGRLPLGATQWMPLTELQKGAS